MRTGIARLFQAVHRIGLLTTCRVALHAAVVAHRTYHPKRTPIRRDSRYDGLPAATVRIPVPRSDVALHAWYIRTPNATRGVVVGHAIGRNRGFSLPYADFLHRAGYNVLVFDHRNHGDSDEDRAFWHMARRFTDDMEAAVSWLRTTGSQEIAILTFSFSTFSALHVLRRDEAAVRAVVADSGPCTRVENLCHHFLQAGKARLPAWLVRPGVFEVFAQVYAWVVTRMLDADWPPDPRQFATPVLFIANESDVIMPAAEVQDFADDWNRGEFWHVSGASHLAAYKTDPARYAQVVLSFLGRAFEERAHDAPRCA